MQVDYVDLKDLSTLTIVPGHIYRMRVFAETDPTLYLAVQHIRSDFISLVDIDTGSGYIKLPRGGELPSSVWEDITTRVCLHYHG